MRWPWRQREPYRLNLFLVRVAGEDGAQEAIAREISRQLAGQGLSGTVTKVIFDLKITKTNVKVDGTPVTWVDEALP